LGISYADFFSANSNYRSHFGANAFGARWTYVERDCGNWNKAARIQVLNSSTFRLRACGGLSGQCPRDLQLAYCLWACLNLPGQQTKCLL